MSWPFSSLDYKRAGSIVENLVSCPLHNWTGVKDSRMLLSMYFLAARHTSNWSCPTAANMGSVLPESTEYSTCVQYNYKQIDKPKPEVLSRKIWKDMALHKQHRHLSNLLLENVTRPILLRPANKYVRANKNVEPEISSPAQHLRLIIHWYPLQIACIWMDWGCASSKIAPVKRKEFLETFVGAQYK